MYSTGGAFAREVGRRTRDRLLTFVRADRAESIPADGFAADERALTARPDLRSDDAHVLALQPVVESPRRTESGEAPA